MWLSTFLLVTVVMTTARCHYNYTKKIFEEVLGNKRYHVDVSPVLNQSNPIIVYVDFGLLSIVEVNDITQRFTCNGVLHLRWTDERATWNTNYYGGVYHIHPSPKLIWRPRMVLFNTLGKRDLFEDDQSPTVLYWDGKARWYPGSLFSTSCELNLKKYPFDEQTCYIRMVPMISEIQFKVGKVITSNYMVNGAWELVDNYIDKSSFTIDGEEVATFEVIFHIKRRPTFCLLNILLPVVLLSFLNIMVFVIPADSGEKISYGITVLLALAVFISFVSSMLPKSSDSIPRIFIYLFAQMVISLLTVIDSIVIVFLYHMEEKTEKSIKETSTSRNATYIVNNMDRAGTSEGGAHSRKTSVNEPRGSDKFKSRQSNGHLFQVKIGSWLDFMREIAENDGMMKSAKDGANAEDYYNEGGANKYKTIGKYIDFVSFIVFVVIWIIVTLWIFIEIAL